MPIYDEARLFKYERRSQIIQILEEKKRATVLELSQQFGVSRVTIRTDLGWISNYFPVIRTHGGVIFINGEPFINRGKP
jgi:DeoR/GlpR family transcriptional regulator of sugar metabolism